MIPQSNSTYEKHLSLPVEQLPGATLTRKVRELWGEGDTIDATSLILDTVPDLQPSDAGKVIDGQLRLTGVGYYHLKEDDWTRPMGYLDFFIVTRKVRGRFSS